jgi:hypothetical protein
LAEGIEVNKEDFWQLFLDTGAPEAYLMYSRSKRMELTDVFDDPSAGSAPHGLQ